MPRTLSLPALQAMLAQHTSAVFLELLEITHADLSEPIRLVNNTKAIESNGNTYQPFSFFSVLPADVEKRTPIAQITISNVDQTIITALRSVTSAPVFTISIVLAESPDVIEYGPISLDLRDYATDRNQITLRLSLEDLSQEGYPFLRFDPVNFPGLF